MLQAQERPAAQPFHREGRLIGFTDKVKLNYQGQDRIFYITVNSDQEGPKEVFIRSGKAGEEIMADSQALGKLASALLQHDVPIQVIAKTLRGIDGGMVGRYEGQEVRSKGDLIALALLGA